MISYFIEVVLLTIFFLAHLLESMPTRWRVRPVALNLTLARLHVALQGSHNVFFDAATIFSFSMMAASINETMTVDATRTDRAMAYLTATFAGLVVVALQVQIFPTRPRPWMKAIVLFINLVLLTGIGLMSARSESDGAFWEQLCESEEGILTAALAVAYTFGVAFSFLTACALLAKFLVGLCRRPAKSQMDNAERRPIETSDQSGGMTIKGRAMQLFVGLYLAITWILLSQIVIIRENVISSAGPSDQETNWSFGQIIALSTWVPVLVEFNYIMICTYFSQLWKDTASGNILTFSTTDGMEGGLSGRLPSLWIAKLRDSQSSPNVRTKSEEEI